MPIVKPCAFINARSGSTTDITTELRAKLSASFETVGPVEYVEPADIEQSIETAIQNGCDLVIIYGGDGSALSAAKIATEQNIPIAALPGGTMNLLPKTLYKTVNWEEALETALSCEEPRWMAAGNVNGQTFLCGCIIGTPTRLNDVREKIRDKHFKQAAEDLIFNLLDFQSDEVFRYGLGKNPDTFADANLLNIICPQMSDKEDNRGGLEVNALDVHTIFDAAELGLSAVASDWRESENAETNISCEIHVKGAGRIDILLDGEPTPAGLPLKINLEKQGVLVLAPK